MTTFGDQLFQFGGQAVSSGEYPGDYYYTANHPEGGKTFYVNNIKGSSTNDGLSWEKAFAEVSEAITASDAHQATLSTGNETIRNRIFVQGTSTAYASLTSLPQACDLIGVGDNVLGHTVGIPRIGADSGASVGGAICTGVVCGLYCKNIQFQGGGGSYPVQLKYLFRSTFEDCAFFTNGAPVSQPLAGFQITTLANGNRIKNCHWGNNSSLQFFPSVGFEIASGATHWNNCVVEDCYIAGDIGIKIAAECTNGYGSIFKNNYIGYGGETCTTGVDDNAGEGHIIYAGNYIFATTSFVLDYNAAGRAIGNYAAGDFVAAT